MALDEIFVPNAPRLYGMAAQLSQNISTVKDNLHAALNLRVADSSGVFEGAEGLVPPLAAGCATLGG